MAIATVNDWMARMTRDGYAPKSVAKPFRLLKQAMKWAVVQDCFDMDFDMEDEPAPATSLAPGLSFTVEQLEAMLVQAKARQAAAIE